MTLTPWFTAGYLQRDDGTREPVSIVTRDNELGLIVYESLPVALSVADGLRRRLTRYRTARLADFEQCRDEQE